MFARWRDFLLAMGERGKYLKTVTETIIFVPPGLFVPDALSPSKSSQPTPTIIYKIKKLLTTLQALGFIQQRNPIWVFFFEYLAGAVRAVHSRKGEK